MESAREEKKKLDQENGKRKRVCIAFCLLFFALVRQSFPKRQTQTGDCSFARSVDVCVLDPSFALLLLQMLVILLSLTHFDWLSRSSLPWRFWTSSTSVDNLFVLDSLDGERQKNEQIQWSHADSGRNSNAGWVNALTMRVWKSRTFGHSHWSSPHSGKSTTDFSVFHSRPFTSYLLVGAAIFDALESNAEDTLRKSYQAIETTMLRTYNITTPDYIELEDIVIRYQPHKAGAQWKFSGAFFFSLTVITTIGKSQIELNSPESSLCQGRLVACFRRHFSRLPVGGQTSDRQKGAHRVPIKATDGFIRDFFSLIKIFSSAACLWKRCVAQRTIISSAFFLPFFRRARRALFFLSLSYGSKHRSC